MAGSEVAQLLQQIRAEDEAARRGLSEYATVSKHQYITARMENMGRCIDELTKVTGSQDTAYDLVIADQIQRNVSYPPS